MRKDVVVSHNLIKVFEHKIDQTEPRRLMRPLIVTKAGPRGLSASRLTLVLAKYDLGAVSLQGIAK